MARTIMVEQLNVHPDVIEAQLAHAVRDSLGRAYNRTEFIEQRKEMLQAWADYLDELRLEVNAARRASRAEAARPKRGRGPSSSKRLVSH